jgi:hypothetical protein
MEIRAFFAFVALVLVMLGGIAASIVAALSRALGAAP